MVAGSARGLIRLGRLVQGRFEIQRSFRVLFKKLVVTCAAIAVGTFQVRGVIESYVSILRRKRDFFRRSFLRILGKNPNRSAQA
jgi:hypothetical protein